MLWVVPFLVLLRASAEYVAHGWGFGTPVTFTDKLKFGEILRYDSRLDDIFDPHEDTKVEVLCGGFSWTEGPVWIPGSRSTVLFSDVRRNTLYRYDGERCHIYRKDAGCSGDCEWERWVEGGPNGMALSPFSNELLICQHGNRSVSALDLSRPEDAPLRVVTSSYRGARYNSPNDLIFTPRGDMFFTDPSYGLREIGTGENQDAQMENHEERELKHNGVYLIRAGQFGKDGAEAELVATSTKPNGLALSPDSTTLYVSNSDPDLPVIYKHRMQGDGTLVAEGVLIDFRDHMKDKSELVGPGGVDGMSADTAGNIYQTVPSGVAIVAPDGSLLGLVWLGVKVGNCMIGDDGHLYVAADTYLVRVKGNFESQVLHTYRTMTADKEEL